MVRGAYGPRTASSRGLEPLHAIVPPRAVAAEPVALVSITLTSLNPTLPTRDGEITVTGRVTNITKERLYRLEALFWRNQAPILGRAGMEQALASDSNDPLGARYTGVFQNLYTDQNPFLAPNASVDFTLRVRVADLELSPTDGVYLMGVHVLQRGNNVAIGRARVFVPVVAGKPASKLTMTTIVVLNSRPSLVRKGVFSDDHLAAEVGENGRLTALLKAANTNKTTFAVDPALIEELKTMSAGYQVLDSEGTTSAGTGQADATRWLQGFERCRRPMTDIGCCTAHLTLLRWSMTVRKVSSTTRPTPTNWSSPRDHCHYCATCAAALPMRHVAKAAAALHPAAILLADTSARVRRPGARRARWRTDHQIRSSRQQGWTWTGPARNGRPSSSADAGRQLDRGATAAHDGLTHGKVQLITKAAQAARSDRHARGTMAERTHAERAAQSHASGSGQGNITTAPRHARPSSRRRS